MRYIVQSLDTGRFLVPDAIGGGVEWVASLREAGGGVVADLDHVRHLVLDWCEPEDHLIVIDLDRLGSAQDYPIPDGNHGDNKNDVAS